MSFVWENIIITLIALAGLALLIILAVRSIIRQGKRKGK